MDGSNETVTLETINATLVELAAAVQRQNGRVTKGEEAQAATDLWRATQDALTMNFDKRLTLVESCATPDQMRVAIDDALAAWGRDRDATLDDAITRIIGADRQRQKAEHWDTFMNLLTGSLVKAVGLVLVALMLGLFAMAVAGAGPLS